MTLTPLDIDNLKFRTAFRGYACGEVEGFLAEASRTLEEHIKQAERLKARIAELERDVARFRESEDVVKNSMVLAQRTCDELIAAAHQRADAIRREAEAEGEDIRRKYTDLKVQREQFEYAFYGLLTGFLKRLEEGNRAVAGSSVPLGTTAGLPAAQPAPTPLAANPPWGGPAPGTITPVPPSGVPSTTPPAAVDQTLTNRDDDLANFLSALEKTGGPPP